MQKQEPLPEGEITIKVIVRNYKGKAPNQIFGVVINGIEHLDLPDHGTVMVVAKLAIIDGIKKIDTDKWNDNLNRSFLMTKI